MSSSHERNPDRAEPSTTVFECWSPQGEPIVGYRLVRVLGRGGLGEVWEAHAPGGVAIALKRVPIHAHAGQRELEALELLKRVRHPHLLAVHGYWLLDEYLVIGLELAEESLGSLLQRRKQSGSSGLPQEEVLPYLTDAAEALDYLARPVHRVNSHAIRLQHRDVKPANLLLQGGAVKVADFGLAKAIQDFAPDLSFSMTPAYAPPEFFAGETAPTSDQYSLGVTYCELRTGRLPFVGTSTEIREGHLHRQPDLTGLNEREREIVLRALDKNPSLRWAGCVKFIGELARATPAAPAQTQVLSSQPSQERTTLPPVNDTATYRGQPVTSGLLLAANDLVPIPLRRTDIRAAVTAGCAAVTVTQVFRNTHGRALEAVYVFPLPEDSAVHGLRMVVDERVIEGEVREKAEARAMYQEAKQEGHGAALVEQTTPNIFTTSVANLLPDQEICVEIRYVQPLPFEAGQYRFVFPMVVSPRYVLGSHEAAEPLAEEAPAAIAAPRLPQGLLRGDMVSLVVDLDAGVPLCGFDSPSHDIVVLEESGATRVRIGLSRLDEIPNRDFVLSYRVAGPQLEHALFYEPGQADQPGSFLLLATPPMPRFAPSLPREVIFVIDRSGSMKGEPLEQARQAARQLLDRLEPEDAFNLIAFDSQLTLLAAMPLTAEETHLRRARVFLDQIQSQGGTEMLEPLRLALQMPPAGGRERVRMIVFLTDGSGYGERELLAALRPSIGRSRIVAFGIGTAVNRHLLNKLSAAGRGFAEFLYPNENIARVVDRTLKRLSHAVLTDIELRWEGSSVEDVLPERCPDVYRDKPLVVLGRFRGAVPPALIIQGRLAGEPYAVQLGSPHVQQHEKGVPLAVLWARQRIEDLMDRIWEQPGNEPSLRPQVIELSKEYRLSSQFTSFLAVEYRSRAEREQAHGAVTAEIPQYMPEGMGKEEVSLLDQILSSSRPFGEQTRGGDRSHLQFFLALPPQQAKLDRVRRSRCQITYDVEINGVMERTELPFVVGALADLSGHRDPELPPLHERRFLAIDRDSFDDVLQNVGPRLALRVPNRLREGEAALSIGLTFRHMDDFGPVGVVQQIPLLKQMLEERRHLSHASDPDVGKRVEEIDQKLSRQLNEIVHHPEFQRLESTWRGLHYLVHQTETSQSLKIRVLNVSKRDLFEDREKAVGFYQSVLFKKVYKEEFCQLGGEPFGLLIGDYEFSRHPEDISLLKMISNVAAVAQAPFVTAASTMLLDLRSFTALPAPGDLAHIFSSAEYTAWNSFRESEDSRYVALTLPHVLGRLPYGQDFIRVDEFNFDEFIEGKDHDKYLWMSAAWAFAARVTDAYAKYGWFERMGGVDGGGQVEGLPMLLFPTDDGGSPVRCCVEMAIADHRQQELGDLGFLPLLFNRDKNALAFVQARSCHEQKTESEPPARLEFNLNYLLGAARFVHYLVLMARDKLGSFMECSQCERWLNEWINRYVQPSTQSPSSQLGSRYPLAEAHVEVRPNQDKPEIYELIVWLRLHTDSGPSASQQFIAEVPMRM